ncbi:MAG TPA: hypothetical protein VKG86_09375 [Terracidiphilus sp.]|nr:hypothetical protein [Terracidiphilus sp.]
MRKCGLALIALLSICPLTAQDATSKAASAGSPEIFLIGSVHHMHFEERYHYSLIDLQAQVRSLHPDVVCGEIPPEAFNGPMEGNFPPEAAMLAEMAPEWGVHFIPADWRVSFAWQERAEKQESEDKAKTAQEAAEKSKVMAYLAAFSGDSLYDYMNSSAPYLSLIDHIYEDVVGENTPSDIAAGAWHERNRKIVENCLSEAGPARRIVFVFGNDHLPQLRRQLAARGLKGQIPARAFTPAGLGTMSPAVIARWQRNLKNLEGIADGTIAVSADNRAKVKDTNRAPALRSEIEIYLARQKTP